MTRPRAKESRLIMRANSGRSKVSPQIRPRAPGLGAEVGMGARDLVEELVDQV